MIASQNKNSKKRKIVLGMSGGVDSSTALILLKKAGWEPRGVSLLLPKWEKEEPDNKKSIETAKKICQKFNVPHYVINTRKKFQNLVLNYFIKELKKGRTPNPCVICNRYLKFKELFDFAKKHKINYVATGHYAIIKFNPKTKKYELLRAKDKEKDQSYVLSFLPQKWLKKIVFPLGNHKKEEVYQIAANNGVDFFNKKNQSKDFCYVSSKNLPYFLKEKLGEKAGPIFDEKGKTIGQHRGFHFFTIGQRKGIYLSTGPYYVKSFDLEKNALIIAKNQKEIFKKEIILSPFVFISGKKINKKLKVKAKIRYRQRPVPALIFPPKNKKIKLVFQKSQKAVPPGQFCVFYQKDKCLGAGIIEK
ncbi:MAG: tRNA 2-thiouridine(34) synthase MnmA [Candidatus Paceibacterota bacterium]|jgi:tRNA-specific 2-thiouridylase|nr:tRNA 2-thiouridine(34) synthase MnmA [Candidatus Paceibacterota bacterium]MDD3548471.1 tRNA 2-thiouridine(34) synthase MnmA [Candidatus Paceibacterota bacterium]MDD4999219.1 tRNA 2-thiouridine(34) synthase MnmA [Candidatus Paceibacterota bacterium]MDD5545353.1 tRNA 2-thiouridine(34) synthase MnmA [Candidatus Paceibacterota bacterium]